MLHILLSIRPDFRTRALLDKYNLPVIHFRYILDCIGEGEVLRCYQILIIVLFHQLLDLRPMYLVHATPDLKQQFDKYFDSFGDSFFEPTTPGQQSIPFQLRTLFCILRSTFPTS